MMADLRCSLVKTKRHRAWPALHRLGVPMTNRNAAIIAALYATHPEDSPAGNFGDTCLAIQRERGETRGTDNSLTPTERRFLHLLAAEPGNELYERVARMVRMAKSRGVPVNYGRLEDDLKFWNENTKTKWAASFWTPGLESGMPSATEEGAES
jgi:CRISPR system Cascade subunit CasB